MPPLHFRRWPKAWHCPRALTHPLTPGPVLAPLLCCAGNQSSGVLLGIQVPPEEDKEFKAAGGLAHGWWLSECPGVLMSAYRVVPSGPKVTRTSKQMVLMLVLRTCRVLRVGVWVLLAAAGWAPASAGFPSLEP